MILGCVSFAKFSTHIGKSMSITKQVYTLVLLFYLIRSIVSMVMISPRIDSTEPIKEIYSKESSCSLHKHPPSLEHTSHTS